MRRPLPETRIFLVFKRRGFVLKTPRPSHPPVPIPPLMLRKLFTFLLIAVLSGGAAGCKKEKTQAEIQAEKVKAFRERQKKAAVQAYQDIVEKYPDSPFAEQAKQKVQELGGVPAATPAKK